MCRFNIGSCLNMPARQPPQFQCFNDLSLVQFFTRDVAGSASFLDESNDRAFPLVARDQNDIVHMVPVEPPWRCDEQVILRSYGQLVEQKEFWLFLVPFGLLDKFKHVVLEGRQTGLCRRIRRHRRPNFTGNQSQINHLGCRRKSNLCCFQRYATTASSPSRKQPQLRPDYIKSHRLICCQQRFKLCQPIR